MIGRVALGGDGDFHCNREHVGGGEVRINKSELDALKIANDDLKLARGVIAGVGKQTEYQAMQETTIRK